ncbi:MAG: cell division protein ZapA [Rhodobacteraceae bacterium]|nr:cell division protein ZapA [Paracoccaceae bacterium]
MPEVDIHIGGRVFQVTCQEGEEPYLQSAAALLDVEAQALHEAMGRMPESRMLLMAGLMLADKTVGLEEELREAERRLREHETDAPNLFAADGAPAASGDIAVPQQVVDAFSRIAERAESVAILAEHMTR